MFKKVFYLLIIFLNLKGISQNKNHLNFEEKLHEFRFSLHEHLNNINPNKLFIFEFQKNDSLIILMQDFELKHKKEIKKYKESLLIKNKDKYSFKLDNYIEFDYTSLKKSLDTKNWYLYLDKISGVLFVDPYKEIDFYATFIFNTILEKSSYITILKDIKKEIIPPLLSTKKINKSTWEITDNRHKYIYKYIYDLEKGKITHYTVYKLKDNVSP